MGVGSEQRRYLLQVTKARWPCLLISFPGSCSVFFFSFLFFIEGLKREARTHFIKEKKRKKNNNIMDFVLHIFPQARHGLKGCGGGGGQRRAQGILGWI